MNANKRHLAERIERAALRALEITSNGDPAEVARLVGLYVVDELEDEPANPQIERQRIIAACEALGLDARGISSLVIDTEGVQVIRKHHLYDESAA